MEQHRQVQVRGAVGGGGGPEGRVQGAEWSQRGRNSAVGCISVSRSDGWVVALFVLCCHTALAPAWALMRGGRTAGQEHGGPPTQVICHAAVLLKQGDTWRLGGWGWRGGKRSGARLDRGILLSAFTNIQSGRGWLSSNGADLNIKWLKSRVIIFIPLWRQERWAV